MAHIVECEDCGKEFDINSTGHEVETERGMIDLCDECFQKRNRASVVHLDYLGKPYKPITQQDIDRVREAALRLKAQAEAEAAEEAAKNAKRHRPLGLKRAKAIAAIYASAAIQRIMDEHAFIEDEAVHSEADEKRLYEALKALADEMYRRSGQS